MLCNRVKEIAGSSLIIYTAMVGETNFRPRVEDIVNTMVDSEKFPKLEEEDSPSGTLAMLLGFGVGMATEAAIVTSFVYGMATQNYALAAVGPGIKLLGNGLAYLTRRRE